MLIIQGYVCTFKAHFFVCVYLFKTVPLFSRLVTVQSPVKVQVLSESIVTTALLSTAVPFCALSMMFIVPVKSDESVRVILRVETVSTAISPLSV